MIDSLLGGRYRIITTLGSGGFSQTYVAEDTHRPGNPKCAVKHLQPANSNQNFLESARRLFQSEAETLEKLGHHDRIPRLLAYFEENQEFYLVQEFIQGQLLTDKLQPNQRWTENQVWEFIQEILEILVFIHAQGFIHRDIKPSNIIQRQQDNKLVLVDFGSVKQNWTQLLSLTSNIEIPATVGIGTPGYMPMEQARGRPRPNSDIYALGAIAVQALTGLYPMQLEEDFETGELLWQHKAQVSDALAIIITKMVRYHFKDRYETATAALAEVQQLAPLYLPTEINLESLRVAQPQYSKAPHNLVLQNKPSQHSSSTSVIAPTLPVSAKASSNSPALLANAVVPTTIFSPLKPRSLSSSRRPYYITIGATIGAALVALGASYAIYWQPRLKLEQTLEQVENLKATGKYSECILRAATIPQSSSLYTDAQNVLYECKLTEAKRLATNADFKAAIALVSSLPKDTNTYKETRQLIAQWSNSILGLATGKYQAGKLSEAIAIAKDIPTTSSVYQKAQATIKQWQAPKAKNDSYLQAAKSATSVPIKQPTLTKKVVIPLSTYKNTTTASKPRSYTRQASAPTRRITRTRRIVASPRVAASTTGRRISAPTRQVTPTRQVASSRMATSTARKRPILRTASNRRYLQISKKVATRSQAKPRMKQVVRRVTSTRRSNRRPQSYRWTTKTVR